MSAPSYRELFRQALRVRLAELKVAEIYPSDKIQSPVHLSLGQEHHAAALAASLLPGDQVYTTYRSHALYLAKGGDMKKMFAELYGRAGGISGGKAGSMHLCAPEAGLMGSSAIVAATLPHALGAAYAFKLKGEPRVAVSVTGDGSTEEGVFCECLNFASLKKLPVVFVIENNGLAIHARIENRQAYRLEALAGAYGIKYAVAPDGFDMTGVAAAFAPVLAAVRAGEGPAVFEIMTCRYMQHVGVDGDLDKGYRCPQEVGDWRCRDPLETDEALAAELRPELEREIDEAVAFAEASPVPPADDTFKDVI